jgi:hypothetical protein
MNQNLLYVLLFLVAFTVFNKTSEKFIENLSEEDPLCPILKEEWVEKKCGRLLGIGEHEDCPKIKEEAEKLKCKLD